MALGINTPSLPFLEFLEFPLSVDSINAVLKEEELLQGTIKDIGLVDGVVRIYVFKFSNTTRCTHVSDLHIQKNAKYIYQDTPTSLKANVGWSFFSLIEDPHFDLKKHFVDGTLITRGDYILPEPDSEEQRMETLLRTILSYYELGKESSEFKVNQFPTDKGNQEHYCEYSGGGDIFVTKKKEVQHCQL